MNKTQNSHTASSNRINISMEHSRFLPEIEECFKETGIPISASLRRLSAQELPMQILIFVGSSIAGGVIYDLLKAGIKKVFLKFKNTAIVVRDQDGVLFGIHEDEKVDAVVISERRAEFTHIENLDDLLIHLDNLNQQKAISTTLGEITDWFSGGTPSKKQDTYWNGNIPWISANSMKSNRFYTSNTFITEEGLKNGSRLAQKNDILLLVRGSGLYNDLPVGIVINEMAFNQDVKALRIKEDKVSPWYLLYWFLGNKKQLLNMVEATGIGAGKLDTEMLKSIPFRVPSKREGDEIVKTAKSIDDKIELLRQQNQTLEEMAQTLFKEWFVDFRFPGVGKMVDSELGIIPKGWEVKSIQEISDVAIGRTPPRKESEWFSIDKSDWKWVSIRDMGNSGIYISETAECLTKRAVVKFNVPIAKKGTILVSFKLTLGRINIANEDLVTNEAIAHINLKSTNNLNAEFMYLFFKNFNFNSLGSTSSIATAVNSQSIKRIELVIPTNDVLLKFKILINPLFSKIDNNSQQIQTLSQLRDRLLPKLMSGEVWVNNFNKYKDEHLN